MAMKFSVNPSWFEPGSTVLPSPSQSPMAWWASSWPYRHNFSIQHGVPVLLPLHLAMGCYGKRGISVFHAKRKPIRLKKRAGLVDMSAALFSAQARPHEWFTPSLALQQLKTCAKTSMGTHLWPCLSMEGHQVTQKLGKGLPSGNQTCLGNPC